MKKWMALLLACLLCLCAVGAMAEGTVTLSVGFGYANYTYDIYPDGYTITDDRGYTGRLNRHTGRYVFTGAIAGLRAPIEFHANMYDTELENDQHVSYDVTFDGLDITAQMGGSPAISFFAGDQEKDANNCSITLRLYNTGNSCVDGVVYPAFYNCSPDNNKAVEILVHNLSGKLEFNGGLDDGKNGIVSQGITLAYDTDKGQVKINGNNNNDINHSTRLTIEEISCKHYLQYTPTSATCTAAGKQEHYVCTICNRIYLNDDATGETTWGNLPAAGPLGHAPTPVDAKEPTCTEDGNIGYYICMREGCGRLFSDAAGQSETTLASVTLSALKHDLKKVEAKAPTCTEDGNIEHYICTHTGCGRLFSDAAGQNELTASDVILPAAHDLKKVEAREPTYAQDGSIEHWACTRCGKLYTDANGTQELSPAEVILPMLVRTDTLPQTGDSSHLMGWVALFGACCAGLWGLNRRRR